jgi:hypothetical protein
MRRPLALPILVVLVLFACSGNLREDEQVCEEALAHLVHCCPDLDPMQVRCDYEPGGCGGGGHMPDIDEDESQCLRAHSCTDLNASGTCAEVVQVLAQAASSGRASFAAPPHFKPCS